ncbi:hypothetical protein [Clostridium rectalis]|uniref:hypothetical protein n=1 Tax=Clostridium rectalis TaxID=2040295 RepID=UPI000F6431C2|nr:hypothetical protein [Clostridium rectalis]
MKIFVNEIIGNVYNKSEYLELLKRENELCDNLDTTTPFKNNAVKDILENKSISYKIIDSWNLNVEFDIIELDKENLIESIIKITNIELV